MKLDVDSANAILAEMRDVRRPLCRLSGAQNEAGMKLKFVARENGEVFADFFCDSKFQGYSEIMHGGVVAAALDSAMSNCLFAHGLDGVTAELTIRYHQPVILEQWATVRARLDKVTSRLFLLSADLTQDGKVKVEGTAKFMPLPPALDHAPPANTKCDPIQHHNSNVIN